MVGEAENGRLGLDAARHLRPDVVLMDLLMPELDGVAAIAAIKAELPGVEVVALTSFLEEGNVAAALEAGASGYVLKDAEADEIAAAIRAAHAGEVHLAPAVAGVLAQQVRKGPSLAATPAQALTERERQILALVARGLSNKAIAAELSITERTARTHVSNILAKLRLASRTQAALYALERRGDSPSGSRR